MKKAISLIGAALTSLTMACADSEPKECLRPSDLLKKLVSAGVPVEEELRDICYTFGDLGEEFVRHHTISEYTMRVGERSITFIEKKTDLYKTVVGDMTFESPRLYLVDIEGDWLNRNIFPRAMCPEEMACFKIMRLYDTKGNEYLSDYVRLLDGEELELKQIPFFSEDGIKMVNTVYAHELTEMLKEAEGE